MRLAKARVHFIGVGGIGMCGLAELLNNMGAYVTGSDASANANTERLQRLGILIWQGHRAENVGDADVVVYSSAVREDNVEYREARRRKIPLIRRAEALAEMMHLKRGVAIGGTHGKTTTTSLTSSIFLKAGVDPTIIVGGRLDMIKSTAQLGQGEWLIAEADESDGSFTRLSPEVVVITNIDGDHLDYYKTFENLEAAFLEFASRIPFYGVAIVCGDDPTLKRIFKNFGKRWISYGTDADNDYVLSKGTSSWKVHCGDKFIGEIHPAMPGKHNALNALAAILAGMQAGIDFATGAEAIAQFGGVDRRFQHKARIREIDFYDDYGHHPTEIRAVLAGFKEKFPDRRLVTLFQPHRFSRTKICWDDFKTAFGDSDVLFMLDVYPAGEAPIEGVNTVALLATLDHGDKRFLARERIPELREFLKPGDILLTLGAGDISRLGENFSESFAKG